MNEWINKYKHQEPVVLWRTNIKTFVRSGVPRGRGVWGVKPPPPPIPKAFQNRSKLNPIVKTVKNCWI